MRKTLMCTGLAVVALALVAAPALAKRDQTGNGAPSGADYNLQVIAFDHCPAGDFTDSNRHQIAVAADFGWGVCSDNQHQGCTSNGDCDGSAVCREIATCASDGSDCLADDECPLYDEDDLDADWCAAGPLPTGDPSSLVRTNKIFLTPGESFHVLDGNACDSDGATFQMPAQEVDCDFGTDTCPAGPNAGDYCNEDSDCGAITNFQVWIRLVGAPGGKIGVTLCATEKGECEDPDGDGTKNCYGGPNDGATCSNDNDCADAIVCSTDNVIRVRTRGKQSFTNVSSELLTMTLCTDYPCKKADQITVAIFDGDYEDFFWNWNTQGRPHAQLRFYSMD